MAIAFIGDFKRMTEASALTAARTIVALLLALVILGHPMDACADASSSEPEGKPWDDGQWALMTFSSAGMHLLVGGLFVGIGVGIVSNASGDGCAGLACSDSTAAAGVFAIGGAVVIAPFVSAGTIYDMAQRRGYVGSYWTTYLGGVIGAATGTGLVAGIAFSTESFEASVVAGVLGIPLLAAAGAVVGFNLSRDRRAESYRMERRPRPRGALLNHAPEGGWVWSAPQIAVVPNRRQGTVVHVRVVSAIF